MFQKRAMSALVKKMSHL